MSYRAPVSVRLRGVMRSLTEEADQEEKVFNRPLRAGVLRHYKELLEPILEQVIELEGEL